MQIQPYLYFDGRCEEAIEFYKAAVGAEVQLLTRYKNSPDPSMRTDANSERIMHSVLKVGDSTVFACDWRHEQKLKFEGFALSVSVADETEAKRLFEALGKDGEVTLPLAKTFFSSSFGTLTDKFGVAWIITAAR